MRGSHSKKIQSSANRGSKNGNTSSSNNKNQSTTTKRSIIITQMFSMI